MIEYDQVCYLDVQKTGSTFVEAFLQQSMRGAPVRREKHGRIEGGYDRSKFHFITCRRPVDAYASLYASGLEGKGRLRRRLESVGLARFYDGPERFERWLAMMLDPKNAVLLQEDYAAGPAALYGFQTHRFLSLALNKASRRLAGVTTRGTLSALFAAKAIADAVIATERLNEGLAELVRSDLGPHLVDPDAALALLESAPRLNASATPAATLAKGLSRELSALVEDREWFLRELMGYGAPGDGDDASPPALLRLPKRGRR